MIQLIPISLTVVILGILIVVLHSALTFVNRFPDTIPILLIVRPQDVIVGAVIYLKTSIDFAMLMGRLMSSYRGWKNRVAIEIGTAVGNAVGTIAIIAAWILFKHIQFLLGLMILGSSFVLLLFAHEGLDYFKTWKVAKFLHTVLDPVARLFPKFKTNLSGKTNLSWTGLLTFSIQIPFLLGLDDFAGYVPLFSVVNVYGFGIGVMAAHTILNIALFLSPKRTIAAVQNEFVSVAGTVAFILLAFYGIFEAAKILLAFLPAFTL